MNDSKNITEKEPIKPGFWQPNKKKKLTNNYFLDFMIGVGIGTPIILVLFFGGNPIYTFVYAFIVLFFFFTADMVAMGMVVIAALTILLFLPIYIILLLAGVFS